MKYLLSNNVVSKGRKLIKQVQEDPTLVTRPLDASDHNGDLAFSVDLDLQFALVPKLWCDKIIQNVYAAARQKLLEM